MPSIDNQLRVIVGLVLSIIVAVFVGYFIATEAEVGAILFITATSLLLFFFSGYRWWWVIIPAAFASGALLFFGFKIYLYELGLLLCIPPLLVVSALNRKAILQNRGPLPRVFYLLLGYVFCHMMWSLVTARVTGEGGYGNIFRHYFGALWAIIFVLLFHFFGSARYLKTALSLLFGVYLFRVGFTLFTYFVPSFNYIPVINLVLPGSTAAQIDDLRTSAPGLASVAICYLCIVRSASAKCFHFMIMLGALGALLLGGGRVAAVSFLVLPAIAAFMNRKVHWLMASAAIALGAIVFLNVSPQGIENLEPRVQRTLGIFILKKGSVSAHLQTQMSDQWHQRLRQEGVDRWLESPASFLFGNRIRKFDYFFYLLTGYETFDFESNIAQASELGSYESGWFTVLATTGLMGFILYSWAIFPFLKHSLFHLWRNGLNDHLAAFSFLAFFNLGIWIILGWTVGGYPSYELILGAIAYECGHAFAKKPLQLQKRETLITNNPTIATA